jgi:hypothetical protein
MENDCPIGGSVFQVSACRSAATFQQWATQSATDIQQGEYVLGLFGAGAECRRELPRSGQEAAGLRRSTETADAIGGDLCLLPGSDETEFSGVEEDL